MKTKLGLSATVAVFFLVWMAIGPGIAYSVDWNEFFDECVGNHCGAPPSGGVGGGGAGGGPLIVAYTWGPVFYLQEDYDFDGYHDADDNCRVTANNPSENDDGDEYGNECDLCPQTPSTNNNDMDGNGIGDVCDDDIDGDGVLNWEDSCPEDKNRDQLDDPTYDDPDGDGLGNPCDTDIDGDGIPNSMDECFRVPTPGEANAGTDPNAYCDDGDYDDDLVLDEEDDRCLNMQSTPNGDWDRDGIGDPCDNCPYLSNPAQTDNNRDGIGDDCQNV